jgi:S-adenosylmethionine:tRNA ribosyltransferase-isomerase
MTIRRSGSVQCAPMSSRDFYYDLPDDLIAQQPLSQRSASRLLHVIGSDPALTDLAFPEFTGLVQAGDLLVVNDTRVLPARLFGNKSTGGKVELLLERLTGEHQALVQLKANRSPSVASELIFESGITAVIVERQGDFFVLDFSAPVEQVLQTLGHVPLPPYISRPDTEHDRERYQTVFARQPGAVAAPTAGLHFDRRQLDQIQSQGVRVESLTLHVGAGTFQPLRPAQLESGQLHAERLEVSAALCAAVAETGAGGGRVIAIGTTTLRGLESAASGGQLQPFSGETRLFIRPGYSFQIADALLTNFHLPESSLMMLVCAFAGTEATLAAYHHAVEQRYRFFSYGDAMFCHSSSGRP